MVKMPYYFHCQHDVVIHVACFMLYETLRETEHRKSQLRSYTKHRYAKLCQVNSYWYYVHCNYLQYVQVLSYTCMCYPWLYWSGRVAFIPQPMNNPVNLMWFGYGDCRPLSLSVIRLAVDTELERVCLIMANSWNAFAAYLYCNKTTKKRQVVESQLQHAFVNNKEILYHSIRQFTGCA